jgi:hypothetical protein
MPTGTKVDEVYEALRKKGYSPGKAARIAQSQTGEALATGRPPKHAVKAANEVLTPGDDLFRPSSERTTEALAQNTQNKEQEQDPVRQRFVDRLVSVGYTPEDAKTKADRVLAGKTPEQIAEHVKWAEGIPDSYLAPGGITGRTGKVSVRESINASRANRGRGRRFANEPPPEDLTTPSSQRVSLSPGNQILKELRQQQVTRQAALTPAEHYPLPPSAAPGTEKLLREAEQAELDRQ